MKASDARASARHLVDASDGQTPALLRESLDTTVAEARAAVAAYLEQHCTWVHGPGVVLAVSELVSNAVRHAGGWWRLRVRADGSRLSLEVEDLSPLWPEPREPDFGGEGGLGLHIVTRLAAELEVEAGVPAGGKTVRAVWHREPTGGAAAGGAVAGAQTETQTARLTAERH